MGRRRYRHKKNFNTVNLLSILMAFILLILFIYFIFFSNKSIVATSNISIDDLSAFKINTKNMFKLRELSEKYELNFQETLTYYGLENNFFKEKEEENSTIEKEFIMNLHNIKNKYKPSEVEHYLSIISNVTSEVENFPIDVKKYYNDYNYGDSWGTERTYGGNRTHLGTDIMNRENIPGQIPIISMTKGTVENIGWNEKGGYRVGIRSESGNYYYYAHLSEFSEKLEKGMKIESGQFIGYMGDTGYSKIEGTTGNFPVHLHLGIMLSNDLFKDETWINPYPFLRLIEDDFISKE